MIQQVERHDISDGLYVFKQTNSNKYYARFTLSGKWYSKATKEKELDKAIIKAISLQAEYKIKIDNDIPIISTRKRKNQTFNVIADLAIGRMEDGSKSKAHERYIRAINNYHKPFFNECTIREIDVKKLLELDKWRTKQIGRVPAKDTIKDHNAGLQRVFDEAVIQNYITQTELPKLENNGRNKERRSSFSKDEYTDIVKEAKRWINESPKVKTKAIREMLYYYIQIAAMTGIRTGTEMECLTWGDITRRVVKNESYTTITVRKGKTTAHTGTREIICKNDLQDVLIEFIGKQTNCNLKEKIFDAKEGRLSKTFTMLLNNLDMKSDAHGERVLYSLRHSYITWELEAGTNTNVIATQCGTSQDMIEKFYSHVVPSMFADQLAN